MIGTTHFINAIVQHKHLNKVGVLRICLPSSKSLEPFIDWPKDLAKKIFIQNYLIKEAMSMMVMKLFHLILKVLRKLVWI